MTISKAIRLLIVEDDRLDRRLLERLLAQSALDVSAVKYADSLAVALKLIKEAPFDLVLLDLGLPDSRGMESITKLRAQAAHVPVIVVSGLDDEKTAGMAIRKGVQDYLVKGELDSRRLERSIRYALERAEAERELQVTEQRYRTIFENSAVAIMLADQEGRLVSWNKFAERLLGMTREDLPGRHIASMYPRPEWHKLRAMNVCQKGMRQHFETKMVRKDGGIFDVDISLSVVRDSDGGVTGTIAVVRDITERKRMEEALRKSEKRFRQVAENAKEWIWEVDAEGFYTYASPIVEKILGYRPEEILGRKRFQDFFHPDDAEHLRAKVFEMFDRKDVFSEFQTRNLHKSGRAVWLLRSGVPIVDENQRLLGYRGADVDITERMRIHKILDRKQKNLEAIFDAAPLGMLLVNAQHVVVRVNDTIRQMSGKRYQEIINRDPCHALGCVYSVRFAAPDSSHLPCEACSIRKLIEATFESGTPVHGVETRPVLNENGEEVRPWLSVSVEPVNIDGGKHVVVALNDITDRKRAEEELKETMEMKSQFISTVSHELRTPLTAMKEAVIIVLDGIAGKLNKDQKHFLDIARRNIDRLARLIDDVLDFQKLNVGKMKFQMHPNRVDRTIEDVYHTMRASAEKKQIHLSVDLDSSLPPVVYDSDRVIQVLTNLISNAIKFTPEGGTILVSAQRREESLAIQVRDTGLGIPQEALPKIFNRFYRVHRPGKEIKGTGLGLAIVQKIVTGHGGRIAVESEVEKGTTFTILLPLTPPQPTDPGARTDEYLESTLTKE